MVDTSFTGDLGSFSAGELLSPNELLPTRSTGIGATPWQELEVALALQGYEFDGSAYLPGWVANGVSMEPATSSADLVLVPQVGTLVLEPGTGTRGDGLLSGGKAVSKTLQTVSQPWRYGNRNLPTNPKPLMVSAWQHVQSQLQQFLGNAGFEGAIATAFGASVDSQQARHLTQQWISGESLPKLEVIPGQVLQAKGAFSASSNTIYFNQEWVQQGTVEAIAAVLLEEMGHALDSRLNRLDAPGDEGAIFAAMVQGETITAITLHHLKAENDHASFTWQGQRFAVEQAALGEFTVGAPGQVSINYVFDGGAYRGQLAIFSLRGMQNLVPGSTEFIQEAARRALTNSAQGHVVVSDGREGAQLSGDLGERNLNRGNYGGSKTVAMTAGDTFGIMLVPDGTVQSVFDQPEATGKQRPLFSLDAANPNGATQFAQIANTVFAMEDLRRDRRSDSDFNDIIFKIEGATAQATAVETLIPAEQNWLNKPLMQSILAVANGTPLPTDPTTPPVNPPIDPRPTNPTTPPVNPPVNPGVPSSVFASFTDAVVKFATSETEGAIAALSGSNITIGTKTLYIGTQQVTSINQNPIIRLFDSANPQNNWTRTDYEVTGADGRGYGLVWTGSDLYAVFTVDGTQGSSNEDFRRASQDAQQAWLRSYGQGGGPKVSAIGRIDLNTGELLDAAYLSALLSNGNSNSLVIKNVAVNTAGNLVISADSFFSPRKPDGTRMQQVNTSLSSPFAYTIELQPDLKRVISTQAVGWA